MDDVTTPPRTATVRSAAAIGQLPDVPLGDLPGVRHRVLWVDGASAAGVMTIAAGHRLGEHAHRENQHHLWIVEGQARVLGSLLGPGSYVNVPAGVPHDIDATGTSGVKFFYLYVP
jgi:mannose-6-phosphate isomerase-like protein (cupin superfamily)